MMNENLSIKLRLLENIVDGYSVSYLDASKTLNYVTIITSEKTPTN